MASKAPLSAVIALLSVAGCGAEVVQNAASLSVPPPMQTPSTPALFAANNPAQGITGDATFIRTNDAGMSLGRVSGTVGGAGQASVFAGPLFTVRDGDGANAREELYDGAVRVRTAGEQYRYARFYITENDNGASLGVFGVPTAQRLPASGSASYTGTGLISEVGRGLSIPTDQIANSQVDVDFASRTVNASLEVPANAQSLLSSVDRLVARGMTLDGSLFSGTAVRAFAGGARVNPAGANSTSGAAGRFYGPAGAQGPAEVGGVMHISGDEGVITGIFIGQ